LLVTKKIIIMKKTIILSVIAASTMWFGCKSKDKGQDGTDSTITVESSKSSTTVTPAEGSTSPANEPKSYAVTFGPDSALLGKSKEASLKLMPGTATELADPDGKAEGIELSFKMSLTNKNKMGGNSISVYPSEFRLVLDNNTAISKFNGSSFSADPEATKVSDDVITFRLPAGTKPKTLNLFYDETRASVSVNMK
jgi:hypothetical protein